MKILPNRRRKGVRYTFRKKSRGFKRSRKRIRRSVKADLYRAEFHEVTSPSLETERPQHRWPVKSLKIKSTGQPVLGPDRRDLPNAVERHITQHNRGELLTPADSFSARDAAISSLDPAEGEHHRAQDARDREARQREQQKKSRLEEQLTACVDELILPGILDGSVAVPASQAARAHERPTQRFSRWSIHRKELLLLLAVLLEGLFIGTVLWPSLGVQTLNFKLALETSLPLVIGGLLLGVLVAISSVVAIEHSMDTIDGWWLEPKRPVAQRTVHVLGGIALGLAGLVTALLFGKARDEGLPASAGEGEALTGALILGSCLIATIVALSHRRLRVRKQERTTTIDAQRAFDAALAAENKKSEQLTHHQEILKQKVSNCQQAIEAIDARDLERSELAIARHEEAHALGEYQRMVSEAFENEIAAQAADLDFKFKLAALKAGKPDLIRGFAKTAQKSESIQPKPQPEHHTTKGNGQSSRAKTTRKEK